jgi:hypothetical protein
VTIGRLVEGLQILLPYYKNGAESYAVSAQHDILFASSTDKPLEEKHLRRLLELGWFQPEVENGESSIDNYDVSEYWAAHI